MLWSRRASSTRGIADVPMRAAIFLRISRLFPWYFMFLHEICFIHHPKYKMHPSIYQIHRPNYQMNNTKNQMDGSQIQNTPSQIQSNHSKYKIHHLVLTLSGQQTASPPRGQHPNPPSSNWTPWLLDYLRPKIRVFISATTRYRANDLHKSKSNFWYVFPFGKKPTHSEAMPKFIMHHESILTGASSILDRFPASLEAGNLSFPASVRQ